MSEEIPQIVKFFHEVSYLRNVPRTGFQFLGVSNVESVAEHQNAVTFIAFVLAKMEGADPYKAALIGAFHDMSEVRIGDFHKIASGYFPEKKAIEKTVLADQIATLPQEIGKEFSKLLLDFETDATLEHSIAKDADYLECALQAKRHVDAGIAPAQNWIDNATKCLKTESAKKLMQEINTSSSAEWWKNLKKIQR